MAVSLVCMGLVGLVYLFLIVIWLDGLFCGEFVGSSSVWAIHNYSTSYSVLSSHLYASELADECSAGLHAHVRITMCGIINWHDVIYEVKMFYMIDMWWVISWGVRQIKGCDCTSLQVCVDQYIVCLFLVTFVTWNPCPTNRLSALIIFICLRR